MSVVQEVGSGPFTWKKLGMGVFSLLCLVVGVFSVATTASTRAEVNAVRAASECATPDQVDGCLQPVLGRITETRRDSRGLGRRYHFVPSASGQDDIFVRFLHDNDPEELSPGLAAILSGREVTGLAWDGDVVGFDAADERVWTIGYQAGGWTGRLWTAVLFLSLGAVGLLGLGRPRGAVPGYGGIVLIGAMLGSIGSIFASSLTAQFVTFGVVVLVFVALAVWGRARAARAQADDVGPPVHHVQG